MIEQVTTNITVAQLFITFVYRLFFVFGIIAFAVGVGLIFNPVRMRQFFGFMNQWVSMRPGTKWLSVAYDTAAAEHRYRHLLGAVFFLFAAFSIYVLIAKIDVNRVAAAIPLNVPRAVEVLIMESVRLVLIAGSVLAIAVGIMLILFPNALRAIETRANRWYSTDGILRDGDTMHMDLDRWIEGYPRATGGIIASGALVMVVDFGILLLQQN